MTDECLKEILSRVRGSYGKGSYVVEGEGDIFSLQLSEMFIGEIYLLL